MDRSAKISNFGHIYRTWNLFRLDTKWISHKSLHLMFFCVLGTTLRSKNNSFQFPMGFTTYHPQCALSVHKYYFIIKSIYYFYKHTFLSCKRTSFPYTNVVCAIGWAQLHKNNDIQFWNFWALLVWYIPYSHHPDIRLENNFSFL